MHYELHIHDLVFKSKNFDQLKNLARSKFYKQDWYIYKLIPSSPFPYSVGVPLTRSDVKNIKELRSAGYRWEDIADEFGVSVWNLYLMRKEFDKISKTSDNWDKHLNVGVKRKRPTSH